MADVTVWETDTVPELPPSRSYYRENFSPTLGQTVFVLTTFTYTPNVGKIMVFINGVLQYDFTETDSTTVTLNFATVQVGDQVSILGFV